MFSVLRKHKDAFPFKTAAQLMVSALSFSLALGPSAAQAQAVLTPTILNLPAPGTMVTPSAAFTPALINGITIHPENPLEFNFIVGTGDDKLQGKAFGEESTKLIKYFLASLTVPEDEMWVNLSPYEKDRIIPEGFGTTEMGRDLLAQDYILKQLTASLMYPEKELGSEFWKKIYQKAYEKYGTTEIPVDTFNKVWIVPEKAVVYEHGNSAFVVNAHLKVMLEQDYALQKVDSRSSMLDTPEPSNIEHQASSIETEIIREIILPEIEREVNEGKSFANLRQIYHSAILAAWFKQNLRQTLLGQIYVDKAKTKGVDVEDKTVNQKIYAQYLEAFKKGVYNYIKEDYDPATQEIIPRKYFSGGTNLKIENLLETYKKGQSSSPLQKQIINAFLAGQSSEQQRVDINLLELSAKTSAADARRLIEESQHLISTQAEIEKAKEDLLNRIKDARRLLEGLSAKVEEGIVPSGINILKYTALLNALRAASLKVGGGKDASIPAASLFNITERKNLEFRIQRMLETLNGNVNTSKEDKQEITAALNSLQESLKKFKSFENVIFQEASLDEQLKKVSRVLNLPEVNIFYALRNAIDKEKLADGLADILGMTPEGDLRERMAAAGMIYNIGDKYILRPYFLLSSRLKKIASGIPGGVRGQMETIILDSIDVSNFVAGLAWDSKKSEEEIVRFLEGQKRLSPLAERWRSFYARESDDAALRETVEGAKGIAGEFIKSHPAESGEFVLAARVAPDGKSAVVTTAVQTPAGSNEYSSRILLLDIPKGEAGIRVLSDESDDPYNSSFDRIAFFNSGVAVWNFSRQLKWDISDPENPRPVRWQEEETWAKETSSSPFAVDGVGERQEILSVAKETRDEGRETKDERPSSVRQGRSSSPVARESDWEILGVKRGDSFDTIKRAYWRLALQYHPDRNPGDKAKEDKFKDIANAYERIGKEFTEGVRERTENSDFNASASGESAGARGRSAYEAFRTPFFYSADDENDVDVVITRLSDQLRRVDNENTRLDIVRKMTALDPEGFIRVAVILMEVVFRDSSIAVSLEAMKGLHRIAGHEDPYGQETAIHALGILLDHYAKAVVNAAADALVDIGGLQKGLSWEVAIGKLSDRLDRTGMTRETVVDALARLIRDHNSDLALRLVREKLNDENPLVRQGAEEVLARSRNAVGVAKNEDNGIDLAPSDARQGRGGEGAQEVLREAGEGVSVSVIDGTLSSDESYYGILGVARDASAEDIRAAYRELANKLHPDHNMQIHPQMRKSLEEQFREINLAYEILSNPEARADYDFILSDGAGHPDFTGQPETTFDFASASWTSNELRGKDVYERMDIVGRMRHPKDIPILVDVLNNDPETVVRSRAADSLSRIGTREALLALTKVDIRLGYILVNFVVNAIFDSANKKNYLAIHSLVDYAARSSAALLSMIKNESHGARNALIKSAELNPESARNMYELFKISLIYLGETEHAWPGRVDKNNPEVVRITRQELKRALFNIDGSVNELIAEVLKALEPEDYDDILGYYRQRLKNPADGVIRLSDAANLKRLKEPGKGGVSSSPVMTEEEATRQIEEFLKGPRKNELLTRIGFFEKDEWTPLAVELLVELDKKNADLDTPLNFPVPRGFPAVTKRNFTTDYRVLFGANYFGVNVFVHTVIQALREKYRIRADALYQRLLSDKSFSDTDLDAFMKFQAKATAASKPERKDQYKLKSILINSDISFIAHHRQRTVAILKEGSFYAGTDREKLEELQHFIVASGTAGSDFIDATSSEDNPKWSLLQKGEELILGFRDSSRPDELIVFDHLNMEFDWPEKIHDTDGNEFSVKDIDYVLRDKKSASSPFAVDEIVERRRTSSLRQGRSSSPEINRGQSIGDRVQEIATEAPGGIDLNPALWDLQIKRDGNGVPLPLPQQPIENMHIEGFLPIIINITPVTNLPLLLGLSGEDGNAAPSGGGTASGVGPVPVPDAAWEPGHSPNTVLPKLLYRRTQYCSTVFLWCNIKKFRLHSTNARLSRRRGLLVHALRV